MRNPLTTIRSGGRPITAALSLALSVAASAQSGTPSAVRPATPPAAEPAAADSGLVTIAGVITDSVSRGYLSGAMVSVSGTSRIGISDSLGRFRIDSVPPGTRRIDVFHTLLDAIGIALVTPQMELRPRDSLSLDLASPSANTLVTMLCRPPERALGPAAVFGQVLDADSHKPIAGAHVTVDWFEFVANKKRIGTSFEHRDVMSAPDGHFRICGLPADFTPNLTASFKGDTTAKIRVPIDPTIAVVTLRLAPDYATSGVQRDSAAMGAAPLSTPPQRRGSITGRVVSLNGAGISGARVAADRPGAVAITAADGTFALHGIRPGTRSLNIRRIGYEPISLPVDVSSEPPKVLTVKLADFVRTLDTVVVTAMIRDMGLERVGFSRRKKTGMGTYLGPEDIERRHAIDFVDLFTTVPMLRRVYGNGRPTLTGRPTGMGNGCVNYYVDDMPWYGEGVEDFILPAEVGAIEVYSSAFTPSQFRMGGTSCETVVVWTKPKLGIR